MKARTKLEKMVVARANALPPLSEYQRAQAIRYGISHIAKRYSNGRCVCTECLHEWRDKTLDKKSKVKCENCGMELKVEDGRRYNRVEKSYFATISRNKEFQVVRMYLMTAEIRKGRPAQYTVREVFQRWISPNGKSFIIGLSRLYGYYIDMWNFNSQLELRCENPAHEIDPFVIVGNSTVAPTLKRNGFDGKFYDCNPNILLPALLFDNRIETMWKAGYHDLVRYYLHTGIHRLSDNWHSIKIAIRHKYRIENIPDWLDMLYCLKRLNMDVRNPTVIFPQDLSKAHDKWAAKWEARRVRIMRARERAADEELVQAELQNVEKLDEEERLYAESKQRFLDIEIQDSEMIIRPLRSVREFIEEWAQMHHCVYTNRYHKRDDALILHALVNGVSVATIELSLKTLQIIQCRSAHNGVPAERERIVNLIESNKSIIASRIAG